MLELKTIDGNSKTKLIWFTFWFLKQNKFTIKKWEKSIFKSITFIKDKDTWNTYPKVYHLFNLDQVKELDGKDKNYKDNIFNELQNKFLLWKILW